MGMSGKPYEEYHSTAQWPHHEPQWSDMRAAEVLNQCVPNIEYLRRQALIDQVVRDVVNPRMNTWMTIEMMVDYYSPAIRAEFRRLCQERSPT